MIGEGKTAGFCRQAIRDTVMSNNSLLLVFTSLKTTVIDLLFGENHMITLLLKFYNWTDDERTWLYLIPCT